MTHMNVLSALLFALSASTLIGQEVKSTMARWGTLVDPLGNCKAEEKDDSLLLTVSGSHQTPNPSPGKDFSLSPRTLQPIDGDFALEVIIERVERPELKSSTSSTPPAPECSVEAGLLIWQDAKNYICWTSAAAGELPTLDANLTIVRNGKLLQRRWSVSDTAMHLKVFRENGRINVAVSEDGLFWRMPRYSTDNFITNAFAGKLQVGVIALNATDSEFKAQFRKLSVERDARVMIHGNLHAEPIMPITPFELLADRRVHYSKTSLRSIRLINHQSQNSMLGEKRRKNYFACASNWKYPWSICWLLNNAVVWLAYLFR